MESVGFSAIIAFIVVVFIFYRIMVNFNKGKKEKRKIGNNKYFLKYIKEGNLKKVEELIGKGVDIQFQDPATKETPLIAAAQNNDPAFMKLLLNKGSAIFAKQDYGQLYGFVQDHKKSKNYPEIMKLLEPIKEIQALVDSDKHFQQSLNQDKLNNQFLKACHKGDLERVQKAISKGADIDAAEEDSVLSGYTALMIAAEKGFLDIARFLIYKGVKINLKKQGQTALNLAIRENQEEMVQLLLSKGARSLEPEKIFELHIEKGNIEKIKEFIAKGADLNKQNKEGSTPLHIAAQLNKMEIAELLIAKGADVDGKDKYGHNALYTVSHLGKKEMIKLLMAKGSAITVKPNERPNVSIYGVTNEVKIENPNEFAVIAEINSSTGRKTAVIAPQSNNSLYVKDGAHDLFFEYSNNPDALFQGDRITLNNNGISIRITKVKEGNYNIRQVR